MDQTATHGFSSYEDQKPASSQNVPIYYPQAVERGGVSTAFTQCHDDVGEENMDIDENTMSRCVNTSMTRNIERYDKTMAEFSSFLETYCHQVVSDEDNNYNIVDQHGNKKWNVPPQSIDRFYSIVEKMRLNKTGNGFSARQNGIARFFIDFDIVLKTEQQISKSPALITTLVKEIASDIIADSIKSEGEDLKFHALVMSRDSTSHSPENGGFKDGIHMYIDLAAPQNFRKFLTSKMIGSNKYTKSDLFIDASENILNAGSIIDKMSASVLPMLLGACKKNGVGYSPFAVYELVHNGSRIRARVLEQAEYSQWNLAGMFSPMYCPRGVKMNEISPIPTIARDLEVSDANVLERLGDEDSESISIMNVNDPTAREIQSLLNLLGQPRADEYNSWSRVLLAIAHWGDRYKPIARAFSMRSQKYNAQNFEYHWNRATSAAKKYSNAGIGTLVKMAKQDDPAGYSSLMKELLHQKITHYIFEVIGFMDAKSAHLGDYQIADILHSAFPNKYIAVPKRSSTSKRSNNDGGEVTYYSLMLPENVEYRPGFAYKYTEVFSTAPIQLYISQKIPIILRAAKNFFQRKKDEVEATPSATHNRDVITFNIALSVIGRAYSACQNNGSKSSIMKQFSYIATNHQFEYELDVNPYVMGVFDGILEIGIEPKLIRGSCEHKVTRTSLAKFRTFNPDDKYIIEVTQWIIDFVPRNKFDKFMYLIMYLCQSLTGSQKSLCLLSIHGGGENAKSTIMFLMNLTLGIVTDKGYGYKMGIDYLTQTRTNSSAAQNELIPLKFARYTLFSEGGANQHFVENKLKTIMSGETISCRGNYGDEENIIPKSIFVYGSNPPPRMESDLGRGMRKYAYDHGTLRRVKTLRAECKFTLVPDPDKPNHRQANPRIIKEFIYDSNYQGAFLSLLSMTYAMFIMMHGEDIEKVISPNVEKETDDWRRSFDTIDAYINTLCIKNDGDECKLDDMINSYMVWHDKTYPPMSHDRDLIADAIVKSKLIKYIKMEEGKAVMLIGIRFLADSNEELKQGDSRFMQSNEFNFKDYREYTIPAGLNLPFQGKIKPTVDAKVFLKELAELYKVELAAYKLRPKPQSENPDEFLANWGSKSTKQQS